MIGGGIICLVLTYYSYALLAWIILGWIQVPSDHVLGRVRGFLDTIILPLVMPLRRVIPPLRIGGVALDLSVLVLFFAIGIIC